MHLASSDSVRGALGYDNLVTINNAVGEGLDLAEVALAAELRTSFAYATHTEVFYVRSSLEPAPGAFRTEFITRQGFIRAAPAYALIAATTRRGLADATALDMRTLSDHDWTSIDLDLGVLAVDGYDLSGRYVQVTYEAGFDADANDDQLYDQTQVPGWLASAARMSAMVTLAAHPTLYSDDERRPKTEHLSRKLDLAVQDHVRYAPLAKHPL